jgi:hypothetical protein
MKQNKVYNSLIIKIKTILILSLVSHSAFSQIFDEEQNPLSVKWRQINSSGFKIIYPTELEKEAQRMANTLPHIYPLIGSSLGVKKTTIPVLLQNQGVIANGFAQLGPKKSEFFSTPPQQFDSQDWLNNLAVHELRHVAQFDKLTGGKAKPFPELVYFAWFGASLPIWFFEGDAVTTETALTNAGRGRQPSWIMPYRASLLEGKKLSYSKASFGSNTDLTPGYYQLGYLLSSNIRTQQGASIFDEVLTDIKKRPLRLYPFSNTLKKLTGKGSHQWYKQTDSLLKEKWTAQRQATSTLDYKSLTKPAKYASNYFTPVRLDDNNILTLKQSKTEATHLIMIDSNRTEKHLLYIGYQEQPWFSHANGLVVWDEVRYDPRYRKRNYNIICSYNLKTKEVKKLSTKSRLFAPSLSADGKKIVAVKIELNNQCNLVELDAKSGSIIFTYPNPKNLILQTPSFDESGNTVAYISVSEKGKALHTINRSGQTHELIAPSQQQLTRPVFIGQQIAFNAHYSGIDNIYEIDVISKKISALSSAKYGAFNPSFSKASSTIIFNNFRHTGYDISETPIKPEPISKNNFVYFGTAAEKQENTGNVFSKIPDSLYDSKPYYALGNLINLHSITPVIEDEYLFGLQLNSDNLLNTFSSFVGAEYHRDLGRFEYNAGFILKSFYPVISSTYRNRPRRTFYTSNQGIMQGDWRENNIQLQALVPINFNSLGDNYSFNFKTATSYTQRYMGQNMPANYITSLKFPMEYGFSFAHSTRQADRDISPRWAQTLKLTYLHQPFDKRLDGELFAAEAFLYFPGLFKNHSFTANFNYQHTSGVRRYDNEINAVYGYNNIMARNFLKNTLLFNYRFPFAFPDAELGPLAYIRNIRGGLFCHYENLGIDTDMGQPKTYGFELRSSMNLLRYQPIIDLGTRFVFVNKVYNQNPIFELILNYSF